MLLFLLILLPSAFITYCIYEKDKKILFPAAAGCLLAFIVCACRFFFTYEHRLVYDSFSDNLIYYIVKQSIVPLVAVSVFLAILSRDKIEYKKKNFFPALCAFFSIYLPYCVITSSEYYYQSYDLFLKPVIYLAMLMQISLCLVNAWTAVSNKKTLFVIFDVLIIVGYLFYPAVSDALYAIDYNFAVILLVGIVYSLVPFTLLIIKQIRK